MSVVVTVLAGYGLSVAVAAVAVVWAGRSWRRGRPSKRSATENMSNEFDWIDGR